MENTWQNSKLEKWLRDRNMSTNKFVQLVGCSRPVVWKVKRGITICPYYAKRISEITQGEIQPAFERVGRPW